MGDLNGSDYYWVSQIWTDDMHKAQDMFVCTYLAAFTIQWWEVLVMRHQACPIAIPAENR